jgi:hypothetical protein
MYPANTTISPEIAEAITKGEPRGVRRTSFFTKPVNRAAMKTEAPNRAAPNEDIIAKWLA